MARRDLPSSLSFLFTFPFLLSLAPAMFAQDGEKTLSQPPAPTPAAKPAAKSAAGSKEASAVAKARIEQRKALGLSLLVSLANDARNFSDQQLRARTLSRIADALWDADAEQGRALFRKAWDSAEVADQESARKQDEDRRRQQADNPRGPIIRGGEPDLRAEVLRLAARRDRALGEELLAKLKDARAREATDASPAQPSFDTPAAVRQRLQLANQLLETDVERALQFADPALGTITMEGLDFLSSLRDKNPVAADQRFARLLTVTDSDVKSDANAISLLSSYLFTPHLFITFDTGGGQSTSRTNRPTPPPDVAPELRNAFFRTAAGVLLRPSPAKEQDRSSSGLQGKASVIRRLLPLFEKYAAQGTTEQLRNEIAVLGQGGANDLSDMEDDSPIGRGITPDKSPEDVEKSLLDRIDRAKSSDERDELYLQLATRAAQRGDLRARDFADKIEESELREQIKPYVDMSIGLSAITKKDTEKALLIAGKGELTHIQRVWMLTEAAKALPPAERDQALEKIGDALKEARRIGGSEPDRPRALVAVANALLKIDRARAWETMLEVAKASNSATGFTGEDGRIMLRFESKNMGFVRDRSIDEFDLPGVFRTLSQENATQAIEIARSFEGEAPRSTALIAVGRSLLNDKK